MAWDYGMIAMVVLGFIILYVLMWIFIKPVKIALRLIANSIIGALLLMIFNYIGGLWGLTIGVNIFTALTCGILGVPGFLLLLVLKWFFHI